MEILALDLATKTGWAYRESGKIISGVEDFSVAKHDDPAMRFVKLKDWLLANIYFDDLTVFYEQPHKGGGRGAEFLIGMVVVVKMLCAEHGVSYDKVETKTLKFEAAGHGNASKDDMILSANGVMNLGSSGFQRKITDDNEADAICLLAYAESQYATAKPKGE